MSTNSGVQSFTSVEGHAWQVDFDRGAVTGTILMASRKQAVSYEFGSLPLSNAALGHIVARGSGGHGQSTFKIVHALHTFCELLKATGREGFSAEAFSELLTTMVRHGHQENSRRAVATHVKIWAATWLQPLGLIAERDMISVERRFKRHFRGFNRRHQERMREQFVHPQEWIRLLRAIRLELESARRLLNDPELVPDHPGMPLMPFVLLCGGLLAVRSAEVNAMNVGDIREENRQLKIHLHAPNKAHATLPLGEVVEAAWEVADQWMQRFRPDPRVGEPLLVLQPKEYPSPVRLDSIWIKTILRIFYRKHFRGRGPGNEPVLFSDRSGTPALYSLPFGQYRSAAITERARQERNPEKLRTFARHVSIDTTLGYYVRQRFLEYAEDVTLSYRAGAEQARMANPGSISTLAERAAAEMQGAVVPGGVCGLALLGRPCPMSRDCMRCSWFKLHPDYRPYFVRELEIAQGRARSAVLDEGLKRDAQILEAKCALLQACIDRIDDFFSESESAA